jgi:hypothetical protein
MAGTVTHAPPQTADPLAEPTLQRRLWSAYLRAGYDHASFAKALGTRYATVHGWVTHGAPISFELFMRACELVGYSLDDIAYGYTKPKARSLEPDLGHGGIKTLADELDASGAQRAALGEHLASPSGVFQRVTRSYVVAFVAAYDAAARTGQKHEAAIAAAVVAAVNARALADAIARGAKPMSVEKMQQIGAELAGTNVHKKPPPKATRRSRR